VAIAIVMGMRGSDKSASNISGLVIICCYFGTEVSNSVEGKPFELLVNLPSGYMLSDLKDGIIAAVQSKALTLGLTVDIDDIDLPSYESGS